ncbi:MAG: response regulator [Magnetococcus sp. MYC-9]
MPSILLVEDDPQLLILYRRFLEGAGYGVRMAGTGCSALREMREQTTDLVITDLLMPEGDGFDLLRKMRDLPQAPSVIVMTGGGRHLSSAFLLDTARALGARAILHKPFTEEVLLQTVREALAGGTRRSPPAHAETD